MQLRLIYCWWCFDLQVFLQQYGPGIASAKFRLVDNANWDLAWSAFSSMDSIQYDKVDLELQELQDQDWWHQHMLKSLLAGMFMRF